MNVDDVFAYADREGSNKSHLTGKAIPGALLLLDSNENVLLAGNGVYTQGSEFAKSATFAACQVHEWILFSNSEDSKRVVLSKDFVYDFRADRQTQNQTLEEAMNLVAKTSSKPITESAYERILYLQESISGLERQIKSFKQDEEKRTQADIPNDDLNVVYLEKNLTNFQSELSTLLSLDSSNTIVPAQIYSLEGLKRCLVYNGPVVLELPVYNANASNGQFWVPPPASSIVWATATNSTEWPKQCVVVVAYSDPSQTFLIRNSWGNGWNGNGHAWIPYSHIQKGNYRMSCFFQKQYLDTFEKRNFNQGQKEVKEIKIKSSSTGTSTGTVVDTVKMSGGTNSRPCKTLLSNVLPPQKSSRSTSGFLGIFSILLDRSKRMCF